ncbi:kinase-like domain-containing protein [Leptodontidium sp. MPI-SDFR-AT-0119]|nr:kinase-like domain-containing protein [Leptodontidium sp. MPI-SDFR-AT-0119]
MPPYLEIDQVVRGTHVAVMIKLPDVRDSQFRVEEQMYAEQFIRECPQIRGCIENIRYTTIKLDFMVYEWMDTCLLEFCPKPYILTPNLPQLIAQKVLEALKVMHGNGYIHGDVHSRNIFMSAVKSPDPIIKLGDLGHMRPIPENQTVLKSREQNREYRSPEGWKGYTMTTKTDIWSLGVVLAHLMAGKEVLGHSPMIGGCDKNEWCIAKIVLLRGDIGDLPDSSNPYYSEIVSGVALANNHLTSPGDSTQEGDEYTFQGERTNRKVNMKTRTLREELESVEQPIEPACIDFIEYLLTVDPDQRPSAEEALAHPWLQPPTPKTPSSRTHVFRNGESSHAGNDDNGTNNPQSGQPTLAGDYDRDKNAAVEEMDQNRSADETPAPEVENGNDQPQSVQRRRMDIPHCKCG